MYYGISNFYAVYKSDENEMNVADEEHPKKEISTATSGAPARSAHRSPEIHGPFSSPFRDLILRLVFSRHFHVSLSCTSGPSTRIRGTKRLVPLLSRLHPIHKAVRSLWSIANLDICCTIMATRTYMYTHIYVALNYRWTEWIVFSECRYIDDLEEPGNADVYCLTFLKSLFDANAEG